MSTTAVTNLVAICAGVLGIAAYVGLILVPAWSSYSRLWERIIAALLSVYVLAVAAALGVAGGLAYIYFRG